MPYFIWTRFLKVLDRSSNSYSSPITISGKQFSPLMERLYYPLGNDNKTHFDQNILLNKIKEHPEQNIKFSSHLGMCGGLTHYWFLYHLLGQEEKPIHTPARGHDRNIIYKLDDINFDAISEEDRQIISDIDSDRKNIYFTLRN
ncbi:MAG: hypothetical protein H2069_05975 [Legionella sp.]|nr:hypothetical protein [Legionella sp.]